MDPLRRRLPLLAAPLAALLATACVGEGTVFVAPDASGSPDADAGADAPNDLRDADSTPDLPSDARDAAADRDATADTGPEDLGADGLPDAGDTADDGSTEPAPCLADGVLGECVPTATCSGDTTPGLCEGPSDVQCCTPSDAIHCDVEGEPGECLPTAECTESRAPTPGYCPNLPADVQCCTPIGEGECNPAAMPLPNEGLEEAPGVGGCPDGMVPVDDFCIDQYEAALVEVLADGSTRSWSPYHNPGTRRVRAVSLAGAVPQGYISGDQAADACDEADKRLCTDAEWLRACRGAGGTNAYPYGASQVEGWCNENRPVHPAVEYFGTSADWIWSQLGNACINQLPDSLALTGEYAECVSAEEVYDLVGNLHEWTADPAGTFRGGFYVDTSRNGLGCSYATTAHNTLHWDYSTGFRCCAD